MTTAPREEGAAVDLWAMAAELERQFAGYKERFAERTSSCVVDDIVAAADGDDDAGGALRVADSRDASSGEEEEDEAGDGDRDGGGGGVRGRMYEAYTRRRDERLRSVWRARMERKEAEVMAIWAQLRGGGPAAAVADECITAGEEAGDNGEKRRSSDVAAPGRVSGKKHAFTRRSLSSANLIKSSRPDVGLRRALSQEPPEPRPAGAEGGSRKHGHRSRAVTGGAAPKRKALSGGSKGLAKEHGSLRQTGSKPPRRGLPRQCSPGGPEAALVSNTGLATPARISISSEQTSAVSDRDDDAREASPPGPESDCGVVVDGAAPAREGGEAAEAKNAVINAERRDGEEIVVQSLETDAKLGNGEITSDSETEPSYVFIKKKAVEEGTMRLCDALGAGSDAEPRLEGKNVTGDPDPTTTAADNAEEAAPEEESSDGLSSFSGTVSMSGQDDSAPNSALSCSFRARSIERQLEEDAALLRKKRQHQSGSGRRSVQAASTPPSARSRGAASAARTTSPRGTAMGFKKRFLSFGKNRDRDGCTVIDCTSPASVPASPADSGRATRRCRTADPVRRRVLGSSSDTAAASDDTRACSLQSLVAASPAKSELGEMVPQERSPKSHRSFFSFRSFNCGRG